MNKKTESVALPIHFLNLLQNCKNHSENLSSIIDLIKNSESEEEKMILTDYLKEISDNISSNILELENLAIPTFGTRDSIKP